MTLNLLILLKTWNLQSTEGAAITLTFDSLDIEGHFECGYDFIEVNDGFTTQRYCGPYWGNYYSGDGNNAVSIGPSIPGPFTSSGTNITLKFSSDINVAGHGFLAVVCCSVNISTDVIGELM